MDLMNMLGDQMRDAGVRTAIDFLGERFGIPDAVTDPLKNIVGNLNNEQLTHLTAGLNELREGDFQGAAAKFSNLIQAFPKEGVLYWLRGLTNHAPTQDLAKAKELDANLPDLTTFSNFFK